VIQSFEDANAKITEYFNAMMEMENDASVIAAIKSFQE